MIAYIQSQESFKILLFPELRKKIIARILEIQFLR